MTLDLRVWKNEFNISDADYEFLILLNPTFALMVVSLLVESKGKDLKFGIFSGLRTWEEQAKEYAKGRKLLADGTWEIVNEKEIVTKARPGYSWHCYGLACDLVLDGSDKPGLQPSWNEFADANKDKVNDWDTLGQIGESIGLEWGGHCVPGIVDVPHFQYHKGLTINQAISLRTSGIQAVWNKLIIPD
jgi:hypothetical protein